MVAFETTVIPCTGMHALKPKYLDIDAALNKLFGHFWITVLMPHLKHGNLGLNTAFNIEILINLIKIKLLFLKYKKILNKIINCI